MTKNAVLVCALAVLAVAYAGVIDHHSLKSIHDECQADPATRIGEHDSDDGVIDNIGPHTHCMITKAGLLTSDGDVNREVLKEHITKNSQHEPAKVDEIINDCAKRVGTTPVAAAIALKECLRKYEGSTSHIHHKPQPKIWI